VTAMAAAQMIYISTLKHHLALTAVNTDHSDA